MTEPKSVQEQFYDIAAEHPGTPAGLMAMMADPNFKRLFPHAVLAIDFGDKQLAPVPLLVEAPERWRWGAEGPVLRPGPRPWPSASWDSALGEYRNAQNATLTSADQGKPPDHRRLGGQFVLGLLALGALLLALLAAG